MHNSECYTLVKGTNVIPIDSLETLAACRYRRPSIAPISVRYSPSNIGLEKPFSQIVDDQNLGSRLFGEPVLKTGCVKVV